MCGLYDCVPLDEVPHGIIKAALRVAALIGNGLYGVDLKEVNGKPMVIEVNDNPSIDDGVEDQLGGEKLYLTVMHSLRRRIEERLNLAQQRLLQHHGIDSYIL